jgi:GH43 family beta-xylosidase
MALDFFFAPYVSGIMTMAATYLNPVYEHSFADPFVLKYCGEYWAYCTGVWEDGRCFGVLRSRDLVHWHAVGGAMEPLPEQHPCYWAPEVTYHNGRFFLYYSAGDEERMQMRIAIAEHPAGPFVDSGVRLTDEPFAIDGHVFVDEDGTWYLFYATDFLEHSHIGTGTVRDRMLDFCTLAGQPRPVTRPRYDWQVYDPRRVEKGGVRWHTVEGPFVLRHKRRYYQMFSGGNWQNVSYGVGYAVSDSIATPHEWRQVADGERVLPILRTLAGQVVGPGHNSVVRGPDNRQLFCVYHRWVSNARVLAIDRLDWAGERMLVLGPSTTPQPAPLPPTFADFFDSERADGLGAGWDWAGGHWLMKDRAAVQESTVGLAEARCTTAAPCFVAEVSLRARDDPTGLGGFGISLYTPERIAFQITFESGCAFISVKSWKDDQQGWLEQLLDLPEDFNPRAYHLLRLEVDGARICLVLDDHAARWCGTLSSQVARVALRTRDMSAAFAGFALTVGWQDLFMNQDDTPADLGWQTEEARSWHVADQQLCRMPTRSPSSIAKGSLLDSYELLVNARLATLAEPDGCYGFYPAMRLDQPGPLLTIECGAAGWSLRSSGAAVEQIFPLPADFDPAVYQQFRFRKQAGRLSIAWESHMLGEIDAPVEPTRIGLYARGASVAFDMARVTAISP